MVVARHKGTVSDIIANNGVDRGSRKNLCVRDGEVL